MLSMVVAPCADAVQMDNSQESEETVKTSELGGSITFSQEGQQLEENCSPLCPCQCCPCTCSDVMEPLQHSATIPLFLTSDYKQHLSSPYLKLVWSPPKLIS